MSYHYLYRTDFLRRNCWSWQLCRSETRWLGHVNKIGHMTNVKCLPITLIYFVLNILKMKMFIQWNLWKLVMYKPKAIA